MPRLIIALAATLLVGCNQGGVETTLAPGSSEATVVEFNPTSAPVVEFEAPGLHCPNCSAKMERLMAEVPGVVDVKADSETKVISIAFDESSFDQQEAITAIESSGFGPEPAEAEATETEETKSPS